MSKVHVEKQVKISETEGAAPLTILPVRDLGGYMSISAIDEDARTAYGNIEVVMSPAFARALAKALIEIADHVEGK